MKITLPPELQLKKSKPVPITLCPVRASTMGLLDTCPRKFFYKKRLNLIPKKSEKSSALLTGGYFHQFMEFGITAADEVHNKFLDAKKEALGLIEKQGDIEGVLQTQLIDAERDFLKAEVMARIFWEKYPQRDLEITIIGREMELTCSVKVLGDIVELAGRIDRLIQDRNGDYWIQDYKTTSFTPPAVSSSYPWSDACRIYRILAHMWLKKQGKLSLHDSLMGFQLNIIRKPTIRFSPTRLDSNKEDKYETKFLSYLARCEKWYQEQELKDENERVCRQFSLRFEGPLLPPEFKTRLLRANKPTHIPLGSNTDDMNTAQVEKEFPRRAWSCYDPYGRPCGFLPLCQSNWESLSDNIELAYEVEEPPEYEGDSYD